MACWPRLAVSFSARRIWAQSRKLAPSAGEEQLGCLFRLKAVHQLRDHAYTLGMNALLLTRDLLLGSQINGAAGAAGCEIREVLSPNSLRKALAEEASVTHIVIDLTCPGVREELAELVPELKAGDSPPKVIAYGPHVQAGNLDAAMKAGCDRVLTRGQLHSELSTIFAG